MAKKILEDVTFHVPVGELLCLSGPNGAGKSTLLKVVVANVRGKWPLRISPDERDVAMTALKRVGAEKLAVAQMKDLSGGETQRVFLARALSIKPDLLILDEPTAGVDVGGRASIVDLMAEISASETIAAVLVTHNFQAIARCAERVLYSNDRFARGALVRAKPRERLERDPHRRRPSRHRNGHGLSIASPPHAGWRMGARGFTLGGPLFEREHFRSGPSTPENFFGE